MAKLVNCQVAQKDAFTPYFDGQIDNLGWQDPIGTTCEVKGCNCLKKKCTDPITIGAERPRIFHFQFSSNSENSLSDQKRKSKEIPSQAGTISHARWLDRTRNSEKKKQQQHQVCGSRIGKSEKK
ncbi:hypothetical protein GBA52_008177 [Prunus armeniaca]|nr:hypothetical protein GBA52_008177 [Prunus armeniaca]